MQIAAPKTHHRENRLSAFIICERGATSIEYALIASLIAVVIITAVTALGSSVLSMYQGTADAMSQ